MIEDSNTEVAEEEEEEEEEDGVLHRNKLPPSTRETERRGLERRFRRIPPVVMGLTTTGSMVLNGAGISAGLLST